MARIDHSSHDHPNTPVARAACRKAMAKSIEIITIPSSECNLNVAHCEQCGSTRYENIDTEDGYSLCCNEPVVSGLCGRNHS